MHNDSFQIGFQPGFQTLTAVVTKEAHSGLIAPWVQRPALPGPLYPTVGPIIVFALVTSQPRQTEHIDITNREDEEWLLLAA